MINFGILKMLPRSKDEVEVDLFMAPAPVLEKGEEMGIKVKLSRKLPQLDPAKQFLFRSFPGMG